MYVHEKHIARPYQKCASDLGHDDYSSFIATAVQNHEVAQAACEIAQVVVIWESRVLVYGHRGINAVEKLEIGRYAPHEVILLSPMMGEFFPVDAVYTPLEIS